MPIGCIFILTKVCWLVCIVISFVLSCCRNIYQYLLLHLKFFGNWSMWQECFVRSNFHLLHSSKVHNWTLLLFVKLDRLEMSRLISKI